MHTEDRGARYVDLDAWDDRGILGALYEGQLAAVAAVGPALPSIAAAAAAALTGLRRGGRLAYVGAGTSGRICVQDGAELSPTFDWPEERLVLALAGNLGAMHEAVENAEDDVDAGGSAMVGASIGPDDVVIGVAASGTTPYTLASVRVARERGALTVGIASNPGTPLLKLCDHAILVETGEEVLAGSTRMKAGTAQKAVLNLLSTLIMTRLGRVYRGEMVQMRATNAKLRRRSEAMVGRLTGRDGTAAAALLSRAGGDVKVAVLMDRGIDRSGAEAALARSCGDVRAALAERHAAVPETQRTSRAAALRG